MMSSSVIVAIGAILLFSSFAFILYHGVKFAVIVRRELTIESKAVKFVMVRVASASFLAGTAFGLIADFTNDTSTFPMSVLICAPLSILLSVCLVGN
ncbi:MAG: hypothetical protein IPL78_27650 [Chloroflexi bacterium]|nr:hypothetical protein [Chloroflexota bacterium]